MCIVLSLLAVLVVAGCAKNADDTGAKDQLESGENVDPALAQEDSSAADEAGIIDDANEISDLGSLY